MPYDDMTRCPQTEAEFREYFYALIGRTLGAPADGWEAVMSAAYPWGDDRLPIPEGVGPGIKQQPGAPFFGLTQQYSSGPKGRVFLPTAVPDDLGYFTRCLQYLDDAAGTYAHAKDKKTKTVEPTSSGLIWSWDRVAGHDYTPIQGADAGSGTTPPSGGGGLTEAQVQAMIDASLAAFAGVKLGDKIALRTNSGLLSGIKGGGPTEADAPIEWIGKTGDAHAWESFTIEKGE